jgi:hypothetical protein
LVLSWAGTNAIPLANQALSTSWAGTNAITLANQALQTAWVGTNASGGAAYDLAAIGTNVGTNALNEASAAITLANQALTTAWLGTNASSSYMANIGVGEGSIYAQTSGGTFQLKTLVAGSNITVTNGASDITITSTGGAAGALDILQVQVFS